MAVRKPRTEVCHRSDNLDGPYEAKTVAQENIVIGGQGGGPARAISWTTEKVTGMVSYSVTADR